MTIPSNLRYTMDHEWVLLEKDIITIGITEFAQKQLGDIVFVELPQPGKTFQKDEAFGSVESVKAVTELFCPVDGTLTEINNDAVEEPELLNEDPYQQGWIVKMKVKDSKSVSKLLDAAAYKKFCEDEKN